MYQIKQNFTHEIIIKKSKFICFLFKVNSLTEIQNKLNEAKKTHKDSTHICFGYILNNLEKAHDDGEPTNTAGLPILNVLKKNQLNNVLAIVVRYYGGIKLGSSGLIRAYSKSIRECLNFVDIIEVTKGYEIKVISDYINIKKTDYILKNVNIIQKLFDKNITYIVHTDNLDELKNLDYKIVKEIFIEKK